MCTFVIDSLPVYIVELNCPYHIAVLGFTLNEGFRSYS